MPPLPTFRFCFSTSRFFFLLYSKCLLMYRFLFRVFAKPVFFISSSNFAFCFGRATSLPVALLLSFHFPPFRRMRGTLPLFVVVVVVGGGVIVVFPGCPEVLPQVITRTSHFILWRPSAPASFAHDFVLVSEMRTQW